MQRLTFKEKGSKDCKYNQGNNLLNDLQLHECEWTAIINKANAISWNLKKVLEKGKAPTEGYYTNQG